jgi:hypothetical protein
MPRLSAAGGNYEVKTHKKAVDNPQSLIYSLARLGNHKRASLLRHQRFRAVHLGIFLFIGPRELYLFERVGAMMKAKKVLCVDEDDAAGLLVRTRILEMSGYKVLAAPSGAQALQPLPLNLEML